MKKIINFLKEVAVEFKNITWPKKDTLIQLTIVVISISIVISLILGGFDYLFTKSFALISTANNQPSTTNTQSVETAVTPTINAFPTIASTDGTTKK